MAHQLGDKIAIVPRVSIHERTGRVAGKVVHATERDGNRAITLADATGCFFATTLDIDEGVLDADFILKESVRICASWSPYYGEEGEVVEFTSEYDGTLLYLIKNVEGVKLGWFYADSLESVGDHSVERLLFMAEMKGYL